MMSKENEPAPAPTVTSSSKNTLYSDDNTSERICQEKTVEKLRRSALRTRNAILQIYENMTDTEQRAFDIGEVYKDVLISMEELEGGDPS